MNREMFERIYSLTKKFFWIIYVAWGGLFIALIWISHPEAPAATLITNYLYSVAESIDVWKLHPWPAFVGHFPPKVLFVASRLFGFSADIATLVATICMSSLLLTDPSRMAKSVAKRN